MILIEKVILLTSFFVLFKIIFYCLYGKIILEMKQCRVGLFELPGVKFDTAVDAKLLDQMIKWSEQNHCGTCINDKLWSFRNEQQRDWFIIRWEESSNK